MQTLIAPPRNAYTDPQLQALITAPDTTYTPGAYLLDNQDNYVSDLSANVSSIEVSRDNYATIHASVTMALSQALNWGTDRVQPFVVLASVSKGISAQFNQGVYLVTSPDTLIGETPSQHAVTGYDKLYILNQPVGDSVMAGVGANVLTSVQNAITSAGGGTKVILAGDASASNLASDIIWPLDASSNQVTWLNVINDLLATINYRGMWVDQDGYFRSEPYVDPAGRTPEYVLDVHSTITGLVADPRVRSRDLFAVPNWWRFIQNGLNVAPVEGAGQFSYINSSSGITSYAVRGYYVKKVVFLDAVSQASLQDQAAQMIASDLSVAETWTMNTGTIPHALHFDVMTYLDYDIDGGVSGRKLLATSWRMPLDGSDMSWVFKTALVLQ